MEKEKIKTLFEEFAKTYDQKKSKEIWDKQSKQFWEFWQKRILEGKGELTEEEMQPIIRILDRNALGIRGSGVESVGRAMIPQGAWYRFFIHLKKDGELRSLIDNLFSAKSCQEEAALINAIYEKGSNVGYLTGESANLLNDIMFVANPDKNISILSLNHRYQIIDAFGISNTEELRRLSQGEQVVQTRELLIKWKTKLGLSAITRT